MEPITGSTTALLVVHMQNDIAAAEGAFGSFFIDESTRNDTVGKVAAVTDIVRDAGGAIVYAVVGFEPDYADLVPNSPLLAMVQQFGAAVRGTPQTEIVAGLTVQDTDTVLVHTRTSPFQNTSLDADLRARGVDTVIVCGIATNASVEDAARYATNLGYRTVIASDASSAATRDAHEATLASFGLLGEVADNATLAAALAN